ncbi:helix-turn-helix transcriptional regulator [Occallatibacter riparius]|uniref:helix-turn-helix transcriptional regulator n=1 Tax=Occallatibacter riparius TaxID=1002689 RepID=UPI0036F2F055
MRSWRELRRFSQLELALEAEVSQRHLSFIESGRSAPSRGNGSAFGRTPGRSSERTECDAPRRGIFAPLWRSVITGSNVTPCQGCSRTTPKGP